MDVTMPDGTVIQGVPDGTTKAQLTAKYAAHTASGGGGGAPAARPVADPHAIAVNVAAQHRASIPASSGLPAAMLGAKKMIDNGADALSRIPVLGPAVDKLGQSLGMPSTAQANAYSDELRAKADPMMRVGGEIGASLAFPAGRIANAATGALLSDSKTAGGVAGDAATSMVGGEAGKLLVQGAAKIASPIVRPMVKALMDRGIPLTPGQIAGGAWQKIEDGVQGTVLGLGDMVASAKNRGLGAFNRATVNDVLKPVGVTLPDHIPTGHDAVAFAKKTLGDAYDHVLGSMHAVDGPPLQQQVGNIVQDAASGYKNLSGRVQNLWDSKVAPYFQNGVMDGNSVKLVDRDLRAEAKLYKNSTDGSQQAYAGHVDAVRQAVKDAASRASGPDAAKALSAVDNAYGNFVVLRNAAKAPAGGIFTPGGLAAGGRIADRSVGKGATATGSARMQEFSDAARQVLPQTVPDSGTARRLMLQSLFTSGASGAAGIGGMGIPGAALAGLGALAYTRSGQKLMTGLLAGRQGPQAAAVRGLLERSAPAAGRVTAAGIPLLLARPQ